LTAPGAGGNIVDVPADLVADAIARFRAAPDGDEEIPLDVIAQLEEARDPRIVPFLLEVVADLGGLDLARVEVCEVLKLREGMTAAERTAAAKALATVLFDDEDGDVRNYAAMALSSFFDLPAARAAVERVLLDGREERNVRHNALFAIERSGSSPENTRLLQKLDADPELARSARRILGEWDPFDPESNGGDDSDSDAD
jgi:hypothetical protein